MKMFHGRQNIYRLKRGSKLCLLAGAVCLVLAGTLIGQAADNKQWWIDRGAVDEQLTRNDRAPATQGQVMKFVEQGAAELDENLPGGAGQPIQNLLAAYDIQNNKKPLNIGQLKYIAAMFWDRLIAEGIVESYPWTEATGDDVDRAMVSIGQLKAVFAFDLANQPVRMEQGIVADVTSADWTTVTLEKNYRSMVVIATPSYNKATPPLGSRIQNASGNSFELMLNRLDGQTDPVTNIAVHYLVVEEGVYTEADNGVTMEAVKYTSTVTDRNGGWNAEARTYANTYTAPVVVGQVMSHNDANWSVFWCRGSSRTEPPSAAQLNTGKHVGEDPNNARADETVGYVVIESGPGRVADLDYVAGKGPDNVKGVGNAPPYNYTVSGIFKPISAVLSQQAMDGSDGGYSLLYGANPVSQTTLAVAVDEDQLRDSERFHITEEIAYILFRRIVDADSDGMADDWEMDIVDADMSDDITKIDHVLDHADYDGDGIANKVEHDLDTDPTQSSSLPPVLTFATASGAVPENTATIPIDLSLAPAATETVQITVRVTGGTAEAGSDYNFTEQVVTFNQGESEAQINIDILADEALEPDETVVLGMSDLTGAAVIGEPASYVVQITNTMVDSDGDGLADSWELQHFGNLNQDGTGNPDGDAWNNLLEYKRGGDPNVAFTVDTEGVLGLTVLTPLR